MSNANDKPKKKTPTPGYPVYPSKDDIYSRDEEASDVNPEDIRARKSQNEAPGSPNELNFEDDMTGEDLDVPGNEDDEGSAGAGNEDEENNYYSLGGDDHEDLDEDNG